MTASSYVRHTVTDFDGWKQGYDTAGQLRAEGGVIADSVHRDVNNPDPVVVYHQFADAAGAKTFIGMLDNPEFNQQLRDMGVDFDTIESWICEDV